MKTNTKNKKGFTLIEILIIVVIIGILVSVVLVSMISARNKAQDNSAFSTFKTIATSSYMCLMDGGAPRLSEPAIGNNICSNPGSTNGVWPEFTKTGWGYGNFSWCNPFFTGTIPPTNCGSYDQAGGNCGGNNSTGDFCFSMEKDGKYMWCTIQGCRKAGF